MELIEVIALKNQKLGKISQSNQSLLEDFPIDSLVNILENQQNISSYRLIGKKLSLFLSNLISSVDIKLYETYCQLVLLEVIIMNYDISEQKYPKIIIENYLKTYDRIVAKILNSVASTSYYSFSNEKYLKDLGVCRRKLIPVGPQYVEVDRISRGFLFANKLVNLPKGLLAVLFRTKGFSPVFRMHMNQIDSELSKKFNPEGWQSLLNNVKNLFEYYPEIKALSGKMWLFDPVLEKIDPEISYIYRLFKNAGGLFFNLGSNKSTVRNATFLNPKRKKLYQEGKYHPAKYLVILSRKDLLEKF